MSIEGLNLLPIFGDTEGRPSAAFPCDALFEREA